MKLSELYHKAVEIGMKYDPRDGDSPRADLDRVKKAYDAMDDGERKWFDMDALWNPYLDSRIVCGDEDNNDPDFSKVLVTLNPPGTGEIMIARDIKADLLISHHPDGRALAGLHQVLEMQIGIWKKYGVRLEPVDDFARESSLRRLYSIAVRESREESWGEITEDLPDIARYFKVPWIALHTVADNCTTTYLQKRIDQVQPVTLQDLIDFLRTIPDYEEATKNLTGRPRIVTGREKSRAGKIVVDMTGGEEAPEEIFSSFADSGIRTILCMHATRDWYDAAAEHHVQIVCAGHASSDSLGMNLLLDEALADGIEVYPRLGGFRRFTHKDENWEDKKE